MFPKSFGDLANLGNVMKQAMEVKGKIESMKNALAELEVEAASGGGMVRVVMNGRFELVSLHIEPEIVDPNEAEVLQTLVRAAVNEAVRQVQELVKEKMAEVTGGLNIPGLTS